MDNAGLLSKLAAEKEVTPLEKLLADEIETYKSRTTKSFDLYTRAKLCLPAGISSDYQLFEPYPFYVDKSDKASVIDVDGNTMIDYHGGFGVTLFGYKHPLIVETTTKLNNEQGFLVSLPSTKLVEVSELMAKRYRMPYWRFTCSGTEATLDAIRLARARFQRQYIIKIESGYHGHHDAVWVSVHAGLRPDLPIDTHCPNVFSNTNSSGIPSVPYCHGIPENVSNLTLIAEYNNIQSVETLLNRYPNQIAALIVEPILLNCSMIKPVNGFLKKCISLCRKHGTAVIFDLVKINTAINMKHIEKYWNSKEGDDDSAESLSPDMFTFGKGLSGGSCPCGAIGMTNEFKEIIVTRKAQVAGTYFGNSYAIGLIHAVQTFVTEEKQSQLEQLSRTVYEGCCDVVAKHSLPVIVDFVGNKGCLTFIKKECVELRHLRNYQEYIRNVDPVLEQLFVFYCINRGLWVQPRDEWSLSYQHTIEHARLFVSTFASFASAVAPLL